ncbi:hypothetical protein GCM10017687_59410 [Streptomyces echinatus]
MAGLRRGGRRECPVSGGKPMSGAVVVYRDPRATVRALPTLQVLDQVWPTDRPASWSVCRHSP